MSLVLHSVLGLAESLMAIEKAGAHSSLSHLELALLVCAKIQGPLTKFAGPVGFSSLLSRALALASADCVALKSVVLGPNGVLMLREVLEPLPVSSTFDLDKNGGVSLVAHLLALIETFIGEQLMLTLLNDAWPERSLVKSVRSIEVKS